MSERERVTPEMVLEAYKNTGVEPQSQIYYKVNDDSKECACALGAVMIQRGVKKEGKDIMKESDALFGARYTTGFITSFDGIKMSGSELQEEKEDYQIGYADGKAVRESLINAGYSL